MHVVIIGGGFGGLYAARSLRRAPVRITLVDRRNHHLFQPLLYQVASAALNPSDIAIPIRRVLRRQKNAEVMLADAVSIDVPGHRVVLADGELGYDKLIIATGATHSYFGHDEWEPFAPGLKTLEDAVNMRRRILLAYEAAEREPDDDHRREWMTFVVVGGGPTGVELAGALAEISRQVLKKDFRHIDPALARIVLVEAGPRILPPYSEPSSRRAVEQLKRLGAEVQCNAKVIAIDDHGVTLADNGHIASRTVLWAAGVRASPLAKSLSVPLDKAGRVIVEPTLTIPGSSDVFVIGDLASIPGVPGVAPAAMQMGRHTAKNIVRAEKGQPLVPFKYLDKGSLATIGRAAAVAEIRKLRLSGLIAWLAWLFIHIFYLIGFRNRFLVLAEWAWAYLRNERGARLITGQVVELLADGHGKQKREIEGKVGHDGREQAAGKAAQPAPEGTQQKSERDQKR
jgi:NADH:quinone reductase (non-electrogenic)